eukprot:1159699-Pelagomonas_calceolata.AAC.15
MIHITKPRLQAPVSLPMSGHPKQKGPQGMCHVAATAASHAFLTFAGETVEGSVRGVQQTCEQLGLEHEYYADPEGMRKKWEQIRPGEKYEGVYEATAGSVNASLSCATMMGQAQQRGWSLMENTRVSFPHPEPSILSCTQVEDIQVSEPGNVQILTHDGKLIKASAGQGACMDALGPIVVHGCLRLPAITS